MKLTDFETSKKLDELGFRAESDYCYEKDDQEENEVWSIPFELAWWDDFERERYYLAYDLETMLEALPQYIESETLNNKKDPCHFNMNKHMLCYINHGCDPIFEGVRHYTTCAIDKKESLANMAARLLINLIEDKIVKIDG